MKIRVAGCLGLLGLLVVAGASRADTASGMTGTFGGRGAVTRVRQGAGPGVFSVSLKRSFDGCAGDLSGTGRTVADHALRMSVKDPSDGTTCTVDLVYAPSFGAVTLKESAACLTWHGMACNFEGTFKRAR